MFNIFYRFYPYKLFLNTEGKNAVEDILKTFGVLDDRTNNLNSIIKNININDNNVAEINVNCQDSESIINVRIQKIKN